MILKEIYLYPDLVDYADEIVHPFRDQSRSICNYLERQIKPIKFNADGFKRICFIGKNEPSLECFVNSSKVLIVEIPFDEKQYKTLERNQLNSFFSQILITGIEKCQEQYNIPDIELLSAISRFLENGCTNSWIFKTKTVKVLGVKCSLQCELTIEAFHLSLVVTKGKDIIFNREIFETVPDEIVFTPMFKDVNYTGDDLVVLDKNDEIIYSVNINELSI